MGGNNDFGRVLQIIIKPVLASKADLVFGGSQLDPPKYREKTLVTSGGNFGKDQGIGKFILTWSIGPDNERFVGR